MKLVSGLEEALGHGPCFIEDREDDEYHGESRGQAIGETSLNTTSSSSDTSAKLDTPATHEPNAPFFLRPFNMSTSNSHLHPQAHPALGYVSHGGGAT